LFGTGGLANLFLPHTIRIASCCLLGHVDNTRGTGQVVLAKSLATEMAN